MTQQHPITPPPELRRLWAQQAQRINPNDPVEWMQCVSEKAAQWGADQELEACCELLNDFNTYHLRELLRASRRPKPPSLKEQALEAAQRFYAKGHENCTDEEVKDDFDTIRRALEQLPE